MSFQRRFGRNLFTVASYQYSASALSFVASLVIARLISPAEYGIVAMVSVFAGFVMTFLDTGVSAAGIRNERDPHFYRQLQTLALLIGLVLCLAMSLLAWPIVRIYGNLALFWPSVVTGFTILAAAVPIVPNAVLSKEVRFSEIGIGKLIQTLVNVSLTVLLALLGFSYWALLLPLTISPLAQRIYLETRLSLGFRLVPISEVLTVFHKTRGLIGSMGSFAFFNYWARNADKFMAGKLYGEAAAGIFSRAYSLLMFPLGMITGVYTAVQLPSFQQLKDEGRPVEDEYLLSLQTLNVVAFPISVPMILVPRELAILLWGRSWEEVGAFLPVFGALLLLQCMASTSGALFIVSRKEKEFARFGIVSGVLMVGAIIIGGSYSLQAMVLAYGLIYSVVCVPVLVYFGYICALGFEPWKTIRVWVVDTVGCVLLLLAHGYRNRQLSGIVLSLLFLHKLWTAARLAGEFKQQVV